MSNQFLIPHAPTALPCLTVTSIQYGKVYKGIRQGQVVADKSMVLPMAMTGVEKSQRMAVSLFFTEMAKWTNVAHDVMINLGHGSCHFELVESSKSR